MKSIHKVSPKILLICLSSVAVLAVTAGAVWAYFKSTTQQAVNKFTPGVVDIEINEPNGSSYTISSGTVDNKVITVTNVRHDEHSAPAYVRVKLVPIMRRANGDGSGDAVDVSYVLNSDDWANVGDGFYYYKGILKPDQTSTKVINSATVKDGIPPGKKLEIQVIADAVQVSDEATQSAWGRKFNGGAWQ